jgi:glucose-1-phosphate cytidylyltransferase
VDLHRLLSFHKASKSLATMTAVRLVSQYGLIYADSVGKVQKFREKPVIEECWINAGFFVFEKMAFQHWSGRNLEMHVLPALAERNLLSAYKHRGFWKSMDTSKDQQEMEQAYNAGEAPWNVLAVDNTFDRQPRAVATAAGERE